MSNSSVNTNEMISFIQYHQPTLKDGEYQLNLNQTVTTPSGNSTYNAQQKFYVLGDRFNLKPTDINSMFPPPNNSGNNSHILPQIVLNRSTLPWERVSDVNDENVPWLWLFVYDDQDLSAQNILKPTLGNVNDIVKLLNLNPEPVASDSENTEQASLIQIKTSWLQEQNVIPTTSALKLLTSVRANYASDGSALSELAICIANRLPRPGVQSYVHLLSMEGRYNSNGQFDFSIGASNGNTSFVSLASWSFESNAIAVKGTFKEIVSNLDAGMLKINNTSTEVSEYIERGAVPLYHQMRNGGKTVSWYHGPLMSGLNPDAIPNDSLPVRSSDQLLRFDNKISMFDVSYAAAWQLGRSLMLSNKALSMDLYLWKRQHSWQLKQVEQDLYADQIPFATNDTAGKAHRAYGEKLQTWFSDLNLLKHMPFNYLVPDAELLPSESLRFFTLDQFWIDCLMDGAFSIGRVTKSDHQQDEQLQEKINPAFGTISGFLLKSEVVAGWPSLIVDGYKEALNTNDESIPVDPLPILRMEKLGADTLLCLFDGQINMVDIHLKPEVIHFGFDSIGGDVRKYSKQLKDLNTGNDLQGSNVQVDWVPLASNSQQDNACRVIDIDSLALKIEQAVIPNSNQANSFKEILNQNPATTILSLAKSFFSSKFGKFTSAQFSFEMVEGVPRVRFIVKNG
jgi:hypothetical protein